MRWILDRRERGLSNKILKIYSIRSAGERNFFESRKISAGGWRIIYASQRNLIVEEEEKVSRISKIVIRRYTNFQRKRRIYIIDRTKKEIVIADRYLLWNLDIGFIFEFTRRRRRVTGSKCRPRRETSRQVGQIDLAKEFSRNSVDFRSKAWSILALIVIYTRNLVLDSKLWFIP